MSYNLTELSAIFDRIEAGNRLRKQDLQILVTAARSQQVTIATGDRAAAIGGRADGAVIVTGDRNIVITGTDAQKVNELMSNRSHPEKRLLKAVKNEILARLKQSLHHNEPIQLGWKAQPEKIKRFWDSDLKIESKPGLEPDPKDCSILQVFDEVLGKLLILGDAGAGKTTVMLELANSLCIQAEWDDGFPVPVIFNLSNWGDSKKSIQDWFVEELSSKYGVGRKIGQEYIKNCKLLLILDGLDELRSEKQKNCIQEINKFLKCENRPEYLIACSRTEEYEACMEKLELNGAICLEPIENLKIHEYLKKIQREELWQLFQYNEELLKLAKSPLWLCFIISAPQFSFSELQQLNKTPEQFQQTLIKAFIQRGFKEKFNQISDKQAEYWLIWLAQKMCMESQTEFLIERMQPGWLETEYDRWKYRIGIFFVCCLFSIPTYYLGITLRFFEGIESYQEFESDLKFGMICVPLTNLLLVVCWWWLRKYTQIQSTAFFENIDIDSISDKRVNVSVSAIRKYFLSGLIIGIISGCFGVVLVYLLGTLANEISYHDSFNHLFALLSNVFLTVGSTSFILSFIFLIEEEDISEKEYPNQGFFKSLRGIIIVWLYCGSTIGLFANLYDAFSLKGYMVWNSTFFLILISSGIISAIQHISLRLIFSLEGYIPWESYSYFLNYCTDRLLLQRVGGRYRFFHRLLQEHFAAMPLERVKGDR